MAALHVAAARAAAPATGLNAGLLSRVSCQRARARFACGGSSAAVAVNCDPPMGTIVKG